MLTIHEALEKAISLLQSRSHTPRLDAEILVSFCAQKSITQLFTYPNVPLTVQEQSLLEKLIERRQANEPIAYIIGHKEFWSLNFAVTKDTLIPRPETEHLVEQALLHLSKDALLDIADLGTGCGAIAIALAYERKHWRIDAVDQSHEALVIAKKNAQVHHLENIRFIQSNWFEKLTRQYDAIISNPPYIKAEDSHLQALNHEPQTALIAGKDGFSAIKKIIPKAKYFLKKNGLLIVEHGHDQQQVILNLLTKYNYREIRGYHDLAGNPRFVSAIK